MHMSDELASMTKLACVHSPVTSHRFCQMGDAIIMEAINKFWSGVLIRRIIPIDPDFHNSSDDDSDMDTDKPSGLP